MNAKPLFFWAIGLVFTGCIVGLVFFMKTNGLLPISLSPQRPPVNYSYPECLEKLIKKQESFWKILDSSSYQIISIEEYIFQGNVVYVLQITGDFSPVRGSNCKELGTLGGYIGNYQINGGDFKEAKFVKTVWAQSL